LPGAGSGLSNLVAYSAEKNANPHPETFGTGNPAGIWAPEVANNASIGGALIPMVALGIPGDGCTALLIGAMTINGLEMGPMVFKNSGHIVYLIYFSVALAALVVFFYQFFGMRVFPKILKIPHNYLYSTLLVICMLGTYITSSNLYKCGVMMAMCAVGIVMCVGGLPAAPLILSFVLGPLLEKNMLKAFQYSGTWTSFFTRPISCVLMIITIGCIFSPVIQMVIAKKAEHSKVEKKSERDKLPSD